MKSSAISTVVVEPPKFIRCLADFAAQPPWPVHHQAFHDFGVISTVKKAAETCFHDAELWEVGGHSYGGYSC